MWAAAGSAPGQTPASVPVTDIFLEYFSLLPSALNTGLQQLLPRLYSTRAQLLPEPSFSSPRHTQVPPFHPKSSLLGLYHCCITVLLRLVSAAGICISHERSEEISTMWGKSWANASFHSSLPWGDRHPVHEWSLQQRDHLKSDITRMTEF